MTLSQFLPAHDATTVALDFGVFIAEQARTHRVSQSAIIAAINQQPSAPSRPKAAAASTPPVGAPAEEVAAPISSAEPIQPETAAKSTDVSQKRAQTATGTGTSGDNLGSDSRPMATAKTDVPSDQSQASGDGRSQDSSGVRVASVEPPPKRITQRQRVRECHEAHPDWTAQQVADDLGLTKTNVQSVASQIGIKWDGKKASTTEALKQAVKAAPPRASVPALPIAKSLKDRVRETLTAHPTWTAAQIANHIGHSLTSVSTTLANVRREAAAPAPEAPPQFSGRREMLEHYGAIAKRLGKPS